MSRKLTGKIVDPRNPLPNPSPDKCYRLVKVVEQQEDRVLLQLAIHPAEPVISSRAVKDMLNRYVDTPPGTIANVALRIPGLSKNERGFQKPEEAKGSVNGCAQQRKPRLGHVPHSLPFDSPLSLSPKA